MKWVVKIVTNVQELKFVWIVRHVMDGKQHVSIVAIAIDAIPTKTYNNEKNEMKCISFFLFAV